ncbi:hypothetical protein BV25DRAFT_1806418, partial [Artomyces pyxidatus]
WLYRPIFAMDANFWLKNRLRSSDEKDPGLATGMAYFVENEKYQAHLLDYTTQEDISTCTGFAALANANLKKSSGLRVTGVGAMICRHSLWQANGVGDLQKGERYCNMDYVVFNVLRDRGYQDAVISYDIACQWGKNLEARMQDLPESISSSLPASAFELAVPKFHLPAHTEKCHGPYSLNYKKGVGRTDGEAIERNWSFLNGAASSTKEMGPGARHDALDAYCGYWNWKKTLKLGDFIEGKWKEAVAESEKYVYAFVDFDTYLRHERLHDVRKWEAMEEAWRADNSKPCPFEPPAPVSLKRSKSMSPSILYVADEVLRRALAIEASAHRSPTPTQAAQLQERRNELLKKVRKYYTGLQAHMPAAVPQDVSSIESTTEAPIEKLELMFPSTLDTAHRGRVCSPTLIGVETLLRHADASETLDKIRHNLRLRTYFNKYKTAQITGQVPNTRARVFQDRVDGKLKALAAKYRVTRAAYRRLVGAGEWEKTLRVLADEDIRGLGDVVLEELEKQQAERLLELAKRYPERRNNALFTGEGRQIVSWIWYAEGLGDGDPTQLGLHDDADLRMEWARGKARAARWQEELLHIRDEMRRGPAVLNRIADDWVARAQLAEHSASVVSAPLLEGLRSYALEQADIRRRMARRFEAQWAGLRSTAPWEKIALTPIDGSIVRSV